MIIQVQTCANSIIAHVEKSTFALVGMVIVVIALAVVSIIFHACERSNVNAVAHVESTFGQLLNVASHSTVIVSVIVTPVCAVIIHATVKSVRVQTLVKLDATTELQRVVAFITLTLFTLKSSHVSTFTG